MISQKKIEILVGLFLIAAFMGLLVLALKVSGLSSFFNAKAYTVTAEFDEIGQLKVRAPIKIGGVTVGEVQHIALDPVTFKAVVTMQIYSAFNKIPEDSSASVLTAGLLGDNYIGITPSYSESALKNGSIINTTHSAMILEKLIGQLIYKLGNTSSSNPLHAATGE